MKMKNFSEKLTAYKEYLERKYKIKIGISNLMTYIVDYAMSETNIDLLEKFVIVSKITELKKKRIESLRENLKNLEQTIK